MKANPYVSSRPLPDFSLWEKLEGKHTLSSFELELTARCNLDCRHCYINLPAGDRVARKNELTVEQINRIAGEAVSLGAIWCLLNGGEPLLREDFFDVYLALKKSGLVVSVFTNGTLVTDRHARFFKEHPPRDIEITVYGATAEIYEKITRRPGSYAAFRRGLDALLAAGVPVTLKAMAMRSNLHEMPEISRFCREFGSRDYRFDPFLHLRYDLDPARNKEILSERLSPEQVVELETSEPARIKGLRKARIFPAASGSAEPNACILFGCGIGKEIGYVSNDGLFGLCSSLRHPQCMVDLREAAFSEAWDGLCRKIRGMTSSRKEFLENCAACPIINLCRWCPALAHLETGSLDVPVEHFCRIAHQREEMIKHDNPKEK